MSPTPQCTNKLRSKVYYKRCNNIQTNDSNKWWGPGIVIGQISQQVFVKHSSFYVRQYPCRLQLLKQASQAAERNNPNIEKIDKNNTTQNHNKYLYETSLDSENRNKNHSSYLEDEGQGRN